MRINILVLAVAVAVTLAVPASAITLTQAYTGAIKMNVTDYDEGQLYAVADGSYGTGTGNPMPAPLPGIVGGLINGHQSSTWGILRVSNIIADDGSDTVLWQTSSSSELTMIFWGMTDTYLKQTTDISTGGISQDIHGTGLQLALFEDTTPNYPGNATGPAGWTVGPIGLDGNNMPTYAGVTDGTLVATMRSRPGYDLDFLTDEFFATFNQNASLYGSTGHFLADIAPIDGWTDGVNAVNTLPFGLDCKPAWQAGDTLLSGPSGTRDVLFGFTGTSNGSGPWLLKTTDPVEACLVPEPLTMFGLMMGLVSMGGYVRRRSKK